VSDLFEEPDNATPLTPEERRELHLGTARHMLAVKLERRREGRGHGVTKDRPTHHHLRHYARRHQRRGHMVWPWPCGSLADLSRLAASPPSFRVDAVDALGKRFWLYTPLDVAMLEFDPRAMSGRPRYHVSERDCRRRHIDHAAQRSAVRSRRWCSGRGGQPVVLLAARTGEQPDSSQDDRIRWNLGG
jgi:hypothetical protein